MEHCCGSGLLATGIKFLVTDKILLTDKTDKIQSTLMRKKRIKFLSATLSMVLLIALCMPISVSAQVYNNPNSGGQNAGKALEVYNRAKQAFTAGDYAAAVNLLEIAKGFNHSDKNIILLLALSYAELGDNYNAMMWFRSVLSLDYNFLEARNNYGIFLNKTGKQKEAKKEFETCIQINPNYANAHYGRGSILKDQGDLDGAIEEFRTAIRLRPQYYEAQRDLGLSIYEKYEKGQLKDISESIEKLRNAAKLIPRSPQVHYYLGLIWCAEGNLDEGEKEFRLTLMNDPNHAAGHFELGKLRYCRGDIDRCLDEIGACLKVSPTYTESKNFPAINRKECKTYSAKCKELKGYWDAAYRDWGEVAAVTKQNGDIVARMKDLQKRAQSKVKRKKNEPTFDKDEVDSLIIRGIEEVDEGNLQAAKATFNRALELNPNCWEAYQNLGSILEVEGDIPRASESYNKAMALEPAFCGLYYNMGYVLEKMRLPIEAGRMYKRFHDCDGKYPYDPKHINQLQLEDVRQQMRERADR
ncbi:MAG: tetratricopeptide repeat protein [Candidatus Melainabacteria bacterium]|nr:tetratricopeptide repeat protein [Candidatus Melainabacteria bacterium]